ncbi:soma ferritin-like [Penaeus japonicus]|uniref:soma ferritin-like n=1 Tax=Penaeus japonicus TaxID=27405 RepID=UPI001C70DEAE|nr:soma ferritin-like [Penaeus japonicus]
MGLLACLSFVLAMTSALSEIAFRQNYHENIEALINKQINFHLHASYAYDIMASNFHRCEYNLPSFTKFFRHMARAHHLKAEKLVEYQNKRGGATVFRDIRRYESTEWDRAIAAMEAAYHIERDMNDKFIEIHTVALEHEDATTAHFLLTNYINPQVDIIYSICEHIAIMRRPNYDIGGHLFGNLDHLVERYFG